MAEIRRYRKEDRDFVRKIAWGTAFRGERADIFFAGKDILMDFLTQYFTDYEPESCFVAEVDGRVIGYLIGAKNAVVLEKIYRAKILPSLLFRLIMSGGIFKKKNMVFLFHCLRSFLRKEFTMPDFSKEYPATLHINLEENFRNAGIGSRLISTYLDYLLKERICGVRLATMSDKAGEFFVNHGFHLLHKGRRSYFRSIMHKDIPIYIYGKKLP